MGQLKIAADLSGDLLGGKLGRELIVLQRPCCVAMLGVLDGPRITAVAEKGSDEQRQQRTHKAEHEQWQPAAVERASSECVEHLLHVIETIVWIDGEAAINDLGQRSIDARNFAMLTGRRRGTDGMPIAGQALF